MVFLTTMICLLQGSHIEMTITVVVVEALDLVIIMEVVIMRIHMTGIDHALHLPCRVGLCQACNKSRKVKIILQARSQ